MMGASALDDIVGGQFKCYLEKISGLPTISGRPEEPDEDDGAWTLVPNSTSGNTNGAPVFVKTPESDYSSSDMVRAVAEVVLAGFVDEIPWRLELWGDIDHHSFDITGSYPTGEHLVTEDKIAMNPNTVRSY